MSKELSELILNFEDLREGEKGRARRKIAAGLKAYIKSYEFDMALPSGRKFNQVSREELLDLLWAYDLGVGSDEEDLGERCFQGVSTMVLGTMMRQLPDEVELGMEITDVCAVHANQVA